MQKTKEQLLGRWYSSGLREGTQLERSVFVGDRKCFSSNYLIFLGTCTSEHSPSLVGNTWASILVSALSLTRRVTLGKSSGLYFTSIFSFACWDNYPFLLHSLISVRIKLWYLETVKSELGGICILFFFLSFFFFFPQLWFNYWVEFMCLVMFNSFRPHGL